MHIEQATVVDDELVTAMAHLFSQLSPGAAPPTGDDLAALLAGHGSFLLIARDPDIVGTLTLTLFRVPAGLRAQISSVVVDQAARGRGIGEALTQEAIRRARAAGAARVQLTSRNHREAAHRLYRRLGFELAPTSVFRLAL